MHNFVIVLSSHFQKNVFTVHFTGNNSCLVVFEKPFENIHVAWGCMYLWFFSIEYFHLLFSNLFLKYSFKRYVRYIPIQKKFLKQKIFNLNAWNWNTLKSSNVRGCPYINHVVKKVGSSNVFYSVTNKSVYEAGVKKQKVAMYMVYGWPFPLHNKQLSTLTRKCQ